MEEFGYNKRFKVSKFMGAGYPMLGLLGLIAQWAIAYWVFEVETLIVRPAWNSNGGRLYWPSV